MAGYFGPPLVNHNHSTAAGDGGGLTNLAVTGTMVASGDVSGTNVHATAGTVDETAAPAAASGCPRLDQMTCWAFIGG